MPRDGGEIGPAAKPVRRKRATVIATPMGTAPTSAPIGGNALAELITNLTVLQRHRQFCITQQSRADRAIESLIAGTLGFRIDGEEADRRRIFAQAKAHRIAVEKGGEGHSWLGTQGRNALSSLSPLILASEANRKTWDDLRDGAEKEMRLLAKRLPVYDFAKSVAGFGDLALAAICGEAGIPIGEYRSVSGLWKRMGLAVFDGMRQRRVTGAAAVAQGYSPRRRAQVWAFCSDSMFRHQWHAADEDAGLPARAAGPYGEVYGRRRAHTEPRIEATADLPPTDSSKWTKGRCHNDARRVMTKALLRDLWRVWRGLPPRGSDARTDND